MSPTRRVRDTAGAEPHGRVRSKVTGEWLPTEEPASTPRGTADPLTVEVDAAAREATPKPKVAMPWQGPEADAALARLREVGGHRARLQSELGEIERSLEAAIVNANGARVPKRTIAIEAGVSRQHVYNVLGR